MNAQQIAHSTESFIKYQIRYNLPDTDIEQMCKTQYEAGRMSGVSLGINAQKAINRGVAITDVKQALNLPFLCDECGNVTYNDKPLCVVCEVR